MEGQYSSMRSANSLSFCSPSCSASSKKMKCGQLEAHECVVSICGLSLQPIAIWRYESARERSERICIIAWLLFKSLCLRYGNDAKIFEPSPGICSGD